MATMTASGWGSTLDVNNIVSQLMTIEQQPIKKLDLKEAGYQARMSAFGTRRGGLAALQEAGRSLTNKVVATDAASIKPGLESFVKAYNEIAKPLRDLSNYDVLSRKAAVLQGDTAVRAIQINSDGALATKTAAANLSVRLLTAERAKLNARLVDTKQRYRRQYAALDSLLGSMKSANDALTQQLAGLSNSSSS